MTKTIWAGIVALALVLTCGILEVVCLSKQYEQLANECQQMMSLCQAEQLTVADYNAFRDKWMDLRELSELMLPHIDVYELNLCGKQRLHPTVRTVLRDRGTAQLRSPLDETNFPAHHLIGKNLLTTHSKSSIISLLGVPAKLG